MYFHTSADVKHIARNRTYMYTYTHIHTCIHTHCQKQYMMSTYIHKCIHTHTHTHTYTHTHMHTELPAMNLVYPRKKTTVTQQHASHSTSQNGDLHQ